MTLPPVKTDYFFQYGCFDCGVSIGLALRECTKAGAPVKVLGSACLMCRNGPPVFIRQFPGAEEYESWSDFERTDGIGDDDRMDADHIAAASHYTPWERTEQRMDTEDSPDDLRE